MLLRLSTLKGRLGTDESISCLVYSVTMVEWHYVHDVRSDKAEEYCKEKMKEFPNRVYKIATARSNNPGMTAVYYSEK